MNQRGNGMVKRPKVIGSLGRVPDEELEENTKRPYKRAKGLKKKKKFTLTGVREPFGDEAA